MEAEENVSVKLWDIWYIEIFNAMPDKARAAISLHQWREIGQKYQKAVRQAEAEAAEKRGKTKAKSGQRHASAIRKSAFNKSGKIVPE